MNKNTSLIALAFLIAIAGHWSRKKTLNVAMVVGFFFVALFIAALSEINEKVSFYLALLVTTSVGLAYLPELLTRLGLMSPERFKQVNRPVSSSFKQRNR